MTGGLKGSPAEEQPIRQTGPGHYEGWFDAPRIGTYLVNVVQKGADGAPAKSTVVGLSTAYSPEYRSTQANAYLMNQLAQAGGGRIQPTPAAIFGGDRPAIFSPADMIPKLLFLSMLLFPFDIAIRRLAVDTNDMRKWLAALVGKRAVPAAQRAATPELGRLLDRKGAVVSARDGAAGPDEPIGLKSPGPSTLGVAQPAPQVPSQTIREMPSQATAASRTLGSVAPPASATAQLNAESQDDARTGDRQDGTMDQEGMSRLMAAKLRARKKQDKDTDEGE
jgi:hypothetical protein